MAETKPIFSESTYTIMSFDCRNLTIWQRLWTVIRIPLDAVRFVATGRATIGGPFKILPPSRVLPSSGAVHVEDVT